MKADLLFSLARFRWFYLFKGAALVSIYQRRRANMPFHLWQKI